MKVTCPRRWLRFLMTATVLTLLAPFLWAGSDFDGDGRDDIGCYYPPGGTWYVFQSTAGFWQAQFGYAGTVPMVGDFDGDGRDDVGCYDAPAGNGYVFQSTEGFWQTTFAHAGGVPIVGDFDGDGRDDIGSYYSPRGHWQVVETGGGSLQAQFGYAGTVPVVGDFDGDGRDDIGCYYPPGGTWYVFQSADGFWQAQFGYAGTVPVVGDFDGDGRDDIGCYYAPGGQCYVFQSTEGFRQETFAYAGGVPVIGDFNGDGRDDIGSYYAPLGHWQVFQTAGGSWQATFGYLGTLAAMGNGPWATLTVEASPARAGTVDGAGTYAVGADAVISAAPRPGWAFVGWADGSTEASRRVTVSAGEAAYIAQFVPSPLDVRGTWYATGHSGGWGPRDDWGFSWLYIQQYGSEVRVAIDKELYRQGYALDFNQYVGVLDGDRLILATSRDSSAYDLTVTGNTMTGIYAFYSEASGKRLTIPFACERVNYSIVRFADPDNPSVDWRKTR